MEKNNCAAFLMILVLSAISEVKCDETGLHCEKWDVKFEEGQSITIPDRCRKATCEKAETNCITELECPVLGIYRGCNLIRADSSKPHADCCPVPICT